MKWNVGGAIALIGSFWLALPSDAHRSFAAVFDAQNPINLTGTVTEVEWMNPHTWFYIDVESDGGAVENWGLEMGSPNSLVRRGWRRDSLEIGDVVTVVGFRARDGSLKGAVSTVTLSTGERLFGAQDQTR